MRSRCAQPDVFRAIARPVRRAILDRLRGGEQPVRAIAEPFAMTLSGVSQQLRLLRNAGLVRERRDGRQRYYRLSPEPLKEVRDWTKPYDSTVYGRAVAGPRNSRRQ